MLNAEVVYQIIMALSDEEKQRLMAMLQRKKVKTNSQQEPKGWSEEEIRKKLLNTIFKGTKDL